MNTHRDEGTSGCNLGCYDIFIVEMKLLDFKNGFNSLNRETMLIHIYSNRPELYNYTHCAYGEPSYLFYGSSVKMSEDGTQQGDPETPPLFAETIHTLVKQL